MEELTEAQQIVLNKAKKEYDIKFKTWAIDRAIEITKGQQGLTAQHIITEADTLCGWIMQSPKNFPVPTADEAATLVEQMQVEGEI